ncbi:MAG: hypothetical protein JXP73_17035 [Deltaproteobacteria bacterium]|nr:hypothetical protein [Deltaproteobacteria bacterium]
MIPWRQLVPVFALLLTTRAGQAQSIDAKERTAKKACLAGDFAKGVAILSELYVSTDDPTYIFNQGRCFEQNRRYEDAIARFQEYLRVGKRLSKLDKTTAQTHIADCESLLAKQGSLQTASGAPSGRGESKEAREKAAMRACLTGDVASGVGILTDLFIETKDTTYLFNQGRCFEQNRQYEEAVGRFREYLIKTRDLSPDYRADTERHIAACESYLRDKSTATGKAEPAVSTEDQPVVERRTAEVAAASPTPGRAGSALRSTGVAIGVAGAAGLATGLVLNLKANSMSDDLEKLYDAGVDSSRKRFEIAGWIAYGAGAACVATGAVFYYFGWRRAERAGSVALVPIVGPDMAGTVLKGSF